MIFSSPLVSSSAILCIRILTGSKDLSQMDQLTIHSQALTLFNLLNDFGNSQILNQQSSNTILSLLLEDDKLLVPHFEKLTSKILYLKYEHENQHQPSSPS
jgi:hypothetical protein